MLGDRAPQAAVLERQIQGGARLPACLALGAGGFEWTIYAVPNFASDRGAVAHSPPQSTSLRTRHVLVEMDDKEPAGPERV